MSRHHTGMGGLVGIPDNVAARVPVHRWYASRLLPENRRGSFRNC